MERFHANPPAAVLLDLMLAQLSGRDVCRQLKSTSPEVPVLILSSISDVVDKVLLLKMGADDYVTKPFSPRELLARVQAAICRQSRNGAATPPADVRFGSCAINFETMVATCE